MDQYKFTRRPLVVEGKVGSTDTKLRIVALHTKSKYINQGKSKWNNPDKKQDFIIEAVKNRRRISSEAMRVRSYLHDLLVLEPKSWIVVTGDFNDGPGIEYFEKRYLTHNVTDILLGSTYYPKRLFKHTSLGKVPASKSYTAVFDDFIEDIPGKKVLLDHILVSPALRRKIQESGIAHEVF